MAQCLRSPVQVIAHQRIDVGGQHIQRQPTAHPGGTAQRHSTRCGPQPQAVLGLHTNALGVHARGVMNGGIDRRGEGIGHSGAIGRRTYPFTRRRTQGQDQIILQSLDLHPASLDHRLRADAGNGLAGNSLNIERTAKSRGLGIFTRGRLAPHSSAEQEHADIAGNGQLAELVTRCHRDGLRPIPAAVGHHGAGRNQQTLSITQTDQSIQRPALPGEFIIDQGFQANPITDPSTGINQIGQHRDGTGDCQFVGGALGVGVLGGKLTGQITRPAPKAHHVLADITQRTPAVKAAEAQRLDVLSAQTDALGSDLRTIANQRAGALIQGGNRHGHAQGIVILVLAPLGAVYGAVDQVVQLTNLLQRREPKITAQIELRALANAGLGLLITDHQSQRGGQTEFAVRRLSRIHVLELAQYIILDRIDCANRTKLKEIRQAFTGLRGRLILLTGNQVGGADVQMTRAAQIGIKSRLGIAVEHTQGQHGTAGSTVTQRLEHRLVANRLLSQRQQADITPRVQ